MDPFQQQSWKNSIEELDIIIDKCNEKIRYLRSGTVEQQSENRQMLREYQKLLNNTELRRLKIKAHLEGVSF